MVCAAQWSGTKAKPKPSAPEVLWCGAGLRPVQGGVAPLPNCLPHLTDLRRDDLGCDDFRCDDLRRGRLDARDRERLRLLRSFPGNQFRQVIAERAIRAKFLLIEQSLHATLQADLIGVVLHANRPAHPAVPAAAERRASAISSSAPMAG